MKSIFVFIRKMFAGLDPAYLFKSYVFAGLILTFFLFSIFNSPQGFSVFFIVFLVINFLLFPFAAVAWDDLITTLMGNNIVILPLPIMIIWKIIKIFVLFFFAIFIAPIGMIYIFFANGYHKKLQ